MVEKEVKEQERSVNYAMLSLFQYVASILVILVHCQRLFIYKRSCNEIPIKAVYSIGKED